MNAIALEYNQFLADEASQIRTFAHDYLQASEETTDYGRYLSAVRNLRSIVAAIAKNPDQSSTLVPAAERFFLQARNLRARLPDNLNDPDTLKRLDREREVQRLRRSVACQILQRKCRGLLSLGTIDHMLQMPRDVREEIVEKIASGDVDDLLEGFADSDTAAPGEDIEGLESVTMVIESLIAGYSALEAPAVSTEGRSAD